MTRLRSKAAAAALLMGACAPLHAEEFFPARDQNPLLRGFYLPLPSDGREDAPASFAATVQVSNTLNVEHNSHERLLVDGESTSLDLSFEDVLTHGWRYRFSLPIIHDSGGSFDSIIDDWHKFFGFSRGNRPFYPKGQIDYSYMGQGTLDLARSQTSIGDLAGDLGWYALEDAHRTFSLWGGLKAPTGSVTNLTSDGAWDAALWAHGAWRWSRWQLAAEFGVTQPFGDELFAGAAHRNSVFARGAATREVGPEWSLRVQLDGATRRVEGSDLRFLGPSLQLSVGAARRLLGRWRVEMGFVEDAAVNTAPDITFFLGIHD